MASSLIQSQTILPKSNLVLKLIVFSLGKLNLALPVEYVKKVVSYNTIYNSGLNHMGVTHLDDREITVIDLHKKLFKTSQINSLNDKSYLIITKDNLGEYFGIVVNQTPSLYDIPLSAIRVLPESYRRADTLEIASHVTIIDDRDTSLTVFLLDVDRLL